VKGNRLLTDVLVGTILQGKNAFEPPYYNEKEVLSLFQPYFDVLSKDNLRSIFYFNALRNHN
jgi:hypothetical protein